MNSLNKNYLNEKNQKYKMDTMMEEEEKWEKVEHERKWQH